MEGRELELAIPWTALGLVGMQSQDQRRLPMPCSDGIPTGAHCSHRPRAAGVGLMAKRVQSTPDTLAPGAHGPGGVRGNSHATDYTTHDLGQLTPNPLL